MITDYGCPDPICFDNLHITHVIYCNLNYQTVIDYDYNCPNHGLYIGIYQSTGKLLHYTYILLYVIMFICGKSCMVALLGCMQQSSFKCS